jgi:NitT/TauT family transport system ATP-binding protein
MTTHNPPGNGTVGRSGNNDTLVRPEMTGAPRPAPPATTPSADDPHVVFDGVTLEFNGRPAIQQVSFTVDRGNFVSIVGPSGCGKSTILNLCAGLLRPTQGTIRYNGTLLDGLNNDVGYVTQDANLLPWLSVAANIGLPLKLRGIDKDEQQERVARWIELMGLNGFEKYFPRELSGGMRKRASLARAMIYDPSVILMDEPFGPLDAITRTTLQQDLLDLCQTQVRTVVFVTHDLTEAVSLSDQVVVMSGSPGTVKGVFDVPIDRPRRITELYDAAGFSDLTRRLWELFQSNGKAG